MAHITKNIENLNIEDENDEYSTLMKKVLTFKLDISQVNGILNREDFKRFKEEYLLKRSEMVFGNQKVVDEIVQKLDMRDLKVFRQLIRSCYDNSKGLWLRKAWIRIRNNNAATNEALRNFTNFFQECLDSSSKMGIPVESFTLSFKDVDSTPEWETFKQICGPHIKSLKIEFLPLLFYPESQNGICRLFPAGFSFPNLKRLHLIVNQRIRFYRLLVIFPSLEELLVRKSRVGSSSDISCLFSYLCICRSYGSRRNPDILKLKSVNTIGVPTFDSKSLIGANFQLQHLALRLLNKTTEVELANLLNHYRSTLKSVKFFKLKIHSHTPYDNLPLNGSFICLNELELWGNVVSNLDFLRNTPNLVKLKVDYSCIECPYSSGHDRNRPTVFQGDMVQNSSRLLGSRNFCLEKLQVFDTDCKMSSESWNMLTKWMPNLRVLEAPIPDNNSMWTVCDHLEKLQRLYLRFGSEVDDDGMVGADDDMPGTRGITKLKHLQTFELEVECGEGRLTDRSAELGFLNLQHLGSLKLGFSCNLLTEEMEVRLRERIGHFETYRSCRNTSEAGSRFNEFKEEYLSKLGENVFENATIVDEIVKQLEMTDLKVVRQVNKTCYTTSKRLWLKKAWIRIRNDHITRNQQPLREFTNLFSQFLNSPSKMGIPAENFTLPLIGNEVCTPALETFKRICGSHIKSLKIEFSDDILQTSDEAIARIFPSGFTLPNLKRLHLIVGRPLRFNLLLSKFPSLEELLVRRGSRGTREHFENLFIYLNMFRSHARRTNMMSFMNLKTLDTIGAPAFNAESLIGCNYPLQHLALWLLYDTTEVELANVLNHYRTTLTSLKLLKLKVLSHTPFVNVPLEGIFINLNVLELWGNVMTNLDFLRNTPYLMKLKVDYGCFEYPYFSGSVWSEPNVFGGDMVQNSSRLQQSPYFRLTFLQMFVTDCKMSSESWNLLTKWMPNLRVLEAPIPDNTAMLIVCDHLKQLEKLRLRFGSQVDDNGVIGYDGDMPGTRGITELKFLHSFEVEVDCGQGRLTDRSCELGFLNLQHLGSLKLGFSGNLLTEEMEARLRDRIGHFEMYRSCLNTTATGEIKRCCEWAKFKREWQLV